MTLNVAIGIDAGDRWWPTKITTIEYKGIELILYPETVEKLARLIAPIKPPLDADKTLLICRQFLSELSWVARVHYKELHVVPGCSNHMPFNRVNLWGFGPKTPHFEYMPNSNDPKVELALALYREALNQNSTAYKFLGFFKIINILFGTRTEQVNWINNVIKTAGKKCYKGYDQLEAIINDGKDIGSYLYESGRCAIAHAYNNPIVNPEDPAEERRLTKDIYFLQWLAEYLIENELGIKSQDTIIEEEIKESEKHNSLSFLNGYN